MIFIAAVRLAVWRAVAVGAALLVLAACSDGGDGAIGAPSATVPTLPPQTTTTNPYAIPDVIDAAYVNRVLAGLDAAAGDVMREIVAARAVHREAIERLSEIYVDRELLNLKLQGFQQELQGGLRFYKPNPGNRVTVITELISADSRCIFGRVHRDASQISTNSDPRFSTQWVALRPLEPAAPAKVNHTGWGLIYDGFEANLGPPAANPCVVG